MKASGKWLAYVLLVMMTGGSAVAQNHSGSRDMSINGSAVVADGAIRLTNDVWQAGSVFWKTPVDITKFDTTFTFYLHSDEIKGVADGFTLTIHNDPKGASALGTAGGSLGFGGTDKSPMITKSVAVEFDNYCNTGDGHPDANYDHVGLNLLGNPQSVKVARVPIPLFGDPLQARIRYDGQYIDVFVWKGNEQPAEPLLHELVDIPKTVGSDKAYVGFTAGTGRWFQNHDITNWQF